MAGTPPRAAMVKDLGTRFEQESVDAAADLIDGVEDASRLHTMLATARVHSPLFTLRGGTNEVLRGVVAKTRAKQQNTAGDELSQLVDDVGRRAFAAKLGQRGLADQFDADLWSTLEETGLTRLTSAQDASLQESAVVLEGLARWAAAVPLAETDVLAAWLAAQAGLEMPDAGPLSVAILDGAEITDSYTLAGEPRGTVAFDVPVADTVRLSSAVGDELVRRGAWARCVQIVGAFSAAADLTAKHIGERHQFRRPLNKFQAVQHALTGMLGDIERSRAATALATSAASDFGVRQPPGRLRRDGGEGNGMYLVATSLRSWRIAANESPAARVTTA
jgi:hypothetical protein